MLPPIDGLLLDRDREREKKEEKVKKKHGSPKPHIRVFARLCGSGEVQCVLVGWRSGTHDR
jgi:hypothetical protein